jgi:subtilisin-like proprotein convertase family protein
MLSTLPAAVISAQQTLKASGRTLSGSSVSLVQDPVNPQKMFEVHNALLNGQSLLGASYSTDGGVTWTGFLNFNPSANPNFNNQLDPNLNPDTPPFPNPPVLFAAESNATVAMDRSENIYIVDINHDATDAGGVLLLHKYSFTGATPTAVFTNKVLESWFNTDPVLDPVIAIDNNVKTFTDTTITPNTTQTDTMVNKDIYIAWSSNNIAPQPAQAHFNPSVIKVMASADGGVNWTKSLFVNNDKNVSTFNTPFQPTDSRYSSPQIVFTQGSADGRVPGGQLVFVWNDYANNDILLDTSRPDGGVSATQAAVGINVAGTTGPIADATANAGTPPPASFQVPTTFTATVGTSDASFVVTDVEVSLSMIANNLQEISIDLMSPTGITVSLLQNGVDNVPNTLNRGVTGSNMGLVNINLTAGFNGYKVPTVFDQNAARALTDTGAASPWSGHFRPAGNLTAYNGLGMAGINGNWKLIVTDWQNDGNTPPPQSIQGWTLHITGYMSNSGFGTDRIVTNPTGTAAIHPAPGAATMPYPTMTAASGPEGIGPGISVAVDNTLGAFSPYQGRLYIAYTNVIGGANTDISLVSADSLKPTVAPTWSAAVRVNDDNQLDFFSEGNRPQFMPTIAVDQTTGTVGVMYYDGRWDPSFTRVANSFSDSIDGGLTWSPSTFLNTPKTAIDEITSKSVTLEPVPGNQGVSGTTFGFGELQGLVMNAGHVVPVFFSNLNTAGDALMTAQVTIAAGPRIIYGDMGPITANFTSPVGGATYNNTFAADGTRQFNGFVVQFDRPVDVSTFTPNQVTIVYRDTVTPTNLPGVVIPFTDYTVTPLDGILAPFGLLPASTDGFLATTFLIKLLAGKERSGLGTYSYAIAPLLSSGPTVVKVGAPVIRDKIKTVANPTAGNLIDMDQGANTGLAPNFELNAATPDTGATGTGYAIGDTLNVVGGTFTVQAQVQVSQVGVGSASVSSPGSGYGVGDLLTLSGGTGTPAQFTVNSINAGGVITGISIKSIGSYQALPTAPFTATGGSGTGAVFNITFGVITALTVTQVGNYSVAAPSPATTTNTGTGTGTGAVLDLTFAGRTRAVFAVPTPLNREPFTLPYSQDTMPLIIPGPHVASTSVLFNPNSSLAATDNLILNGTNNGVEVTFDRNINTATFTPANILSMIGPVGAITGPFTVTPVVGGVLMPAATVATTFRIGFPTQFLSGTYNIVVGPDSQANYIQDVNGNQVDTNLNAGLSLLRGGDPNNGTLLTTTYASGTVNTPLPPVSTTSSVINVPSSFLVQGVTLTLTIQHQNDPDLTATLIAPDGTKVQLFQGVGATGSSPHANFTGTTFDDTATTPIQQAPTLPGTGIGAGPYTPQFALSTFKNHASLGNWTLQIQSNSSTLTGTLVSWSINLTNSVPGSGLGEKVADQFTAHFRIFVQDPTNLQSDTTWTAVGPASIASGGRSGRVTGLALDPSDPSGNTVFVGGASGGIWKTTNFMTTDPNGPTYIPLTNIGQGYSLNTGSIAIFGRNGDPNQSIVFVATGEGDTGTPGVGLLRSMDGGKTWRLLDSTTNSDAAGNILPITDPGRDHKFAGFTSFKIFVDPKASPTGEVILYAAMGPGGLWRSIDTGKHWTLLRAGNATDVVLAADSADSTGNLQILFAAFRGEGIFFTASAPSATSLTIRNGGTGVNTRRNVNTTPDSTITVGNTGINPSGANGRIVLAVPALTGNTLVDILQEGWLYAVVVTTGGAEQGLYMTKDFGLNWTKIRVPVDTTLLSNKKPTIADKFIPTNNDSLTTDYSPLGNATYAQGNYDVSLAVDPNNAYIVYLGGSTDGNPYGFIRVDTTKMQDVYNSTAYDNSNIDGQVQFTSAAASTTGGVTIPAASPIFPGPGAPYGLLTGTPAAPAGAYLSLERDPNNAFLTPSSLQFTNVTAFNNTGEDNLWMPFSGGGLGGTDQHRLLTYRDPLTGHTRLIFADDQGVWTGEDQGDGSTSSGIGSAKSILGSRNGNLQITQFYYGADQPSTLAADLAGALMYGTAQDDGNPQSDPRILENGNLNWTGPGGDYTGMATDQTGSGTSYVFAWPCCGASPLASDFFKVTPAGGTQVSRITGLLQAGDDPASGTGQWPFIGGSNFAVNRIDPTGIVVSSAAGRIFRTAGPSLGTGVQWFVIGDPTDLDSTYAPAMAFGSPATGPNPALNDFIYAGTTGGHIFVTFTGGGVGTPWKNISAGLDGSAVQEIVTNPNRGSHEAYAVTSAGVFWMADSSVAAPTWVNVTGNLFSPLITRQLYNDPTQNLATLKSLTTIQADWRYAVPDDLTKPNGPTHPVLYVGGEGGVYRSLDKGVTWTYFPDITIDGAAQAGGYLPTVHVSDLQLSLGNINPANGQPVQPFGRNMLTASTYGQGTWVIRLSDKIQVANGNPLYTYVVSPVDGPHVVSIGPTGNTTPLTAITVTFAGTIDPVTFTAGKVGSVIDPLGNTIAVSQVVDITPITTPNNHNIYKLVLATPDSAFGFYHVTLGPQISDYGGNQMDQNQNFINGEVPGDTFSGRFLFQPFPNHAPLLGITAAPFTPSVNEDLAAAQITGNTVNAFVTGLPSPGITDPDNTSTPGYQTNTPTTTAPVGIAVTGVDNSNGVWQYSLNGGTTWTNFGSPSNTSARLLEANAGSVPSTDRIRFLPNFDFAGTSSFTFRAWDETSGLAAITGADGGTADTTTNGGTSAFSTAVGTATITVNLVNDVPSFVAGPSQTVSEDAAQQTIANWATNITPDGNLPPAPDEAGQTLNFIVTTGSTSFFAVQPAVSATGTLTYQVAPDTSGTVQVSVLLHDNGGTANGGVDTSAAQTFSITSTFVNDAPSFTIGPDQNVNEDSGAHSVSPWATNVSPDENPTPAANEAGQTVSFIVTNNTNPALFAVPPAIDPTGALTYTLNPDISGSAAITIQLQDNGGTANGGVNISAAQTFNINVALVNDAPSFTKGADETNPEDGGAQSYTGWASKISPDQHFPPASNESGQTVHFNITGDTNPSLFSVAPSISPSGTLSYTLANDVSGSAAITVTLQDSGGTANGGVDTSAPQTFNINVTFVNDAPSFTKGLDQTVLENVGGQTVTGWATNISPDQHTTPAANEAGQTLNFIVTNNNNALFSAQPSIDASGNLTYTPKADSSGTALVTVMLHDSGGTANGGVDTSAAQTFNINVTLVNDAPSFTKGPDVAVNDNAPPQTIAGWATKISPDQFFPPAANEAGQTVHFNVTGNSNPALFAVAPAISPSGTLTFATAANVTGSSTITVTLQDNGGTANGGVDTSAPQTFLILVTFVNQPPSFTKGADQNVQEDTTGVQTVANWATKISPDPTFPPSAIEAGQHVNFIVTNNSNPALFAVAPAIDPSGTLTYTLNPNVSGTAAITVVLHDDGGTANGGVDTSQPQTFNINVALVNDPPSFTKGSDETVAEDAGAATFNGWATKISADQGFPAAANEAGQMLNFVVTGNTNTALFAAQPAIDANGNLTFTPAPNVNGSAAVTVTLHDNGGTGNGGFDTSAPQTFNITVTYVNDAPSFTKGIDQTVLENSGAHTASGWATNISPDQLVTPAANEAGQTVNFMVTGDTNPSLFAVAPSIDPSGNLTYTLGTNVFGTAAISVVLHDNGGTANGGVDTSAAQTFNINVNQPATAVALVSSQNPAQFLSSVTFTATVTAQAGTPTGSVVFTVDSTPTSVPLNTSGVATLTLSNLSVGLHPVNASYAENSAFAGSNAQQLVQTINPVSTSTSLGSSLNPSILGQSVTFTATVQSGVSGAGTPTGSVTFSIDGTPQTPAVTLNSSGVATLTTSTLTAGQHAITATYTATGNFAGSSTTTPLTQSVLNSTTTTLASGPVNPSVFGQQVTFTATVTGTGSGTPTGSVQFFVDGSTTAAGTGALNSSRQASFPIAFMALGAHTVTATYQGDSNFGQSTSTPLTQNVVSDSTTTSVTEPGGATVFGQQATFLAQVTPAVPGGGTPTGALQFFVDGAPQTPVALNAAAQATLTTSTLSVGLHSISAVFSSADNNFTGSRTNTALSANVTKANTTTAVIDVVTSPTVLGEMAIFVASIAAKSPGAGVPTGNVQFTVDGATLPTLYPLNANGQTGLDTSTLALGTHTISASYMGDGNFNASSNGTAPITHVVGQLKTSTIIFPAGSGTPMLGQQFIYVMQAVPVRATGFTPTGGMQFILDGTAQPVLQLNGNGQAGFNTQTLAAGPHTLLAAYGGDVRFAPSGTPTPLNFTVTPITTTTTVTASQNPTVSGVPTTFTATTTAAAGTLPAGSVEAFTIPGVLAQTFVPVNSAGQASITVANLTQGSDTVNVQFFPSNNNFGVSTASLVESVLKASATTVLAAPSSSTYGQPVTLSATVGPAVPGSGTPTGSVTFAVNGTNLSPSVNLNAGAATLTLSTLPAGSDTITAVYSGDSAFGASSSVTPASVTVSKVSTSTSLFQFGASSTAFGQQAIFIATVNPAIAGAAPASGGLEFVIDGGAPIGPYALNGNGQAGLDISTLSVGTHTIGAIFVGGPNMLGSTAASISTTVTRALPTVSVFEFGPAPTSQGQLATFILTVTPPFPGSAIPTGPAQFIVDNVPQPVLLLNGNGQAGLYTTTLALGQHTVLASYGGDGNYQPAGTPTPFVATVVTPTTAVRLSSPNLNVAANTPFSINVTALTATNTTATTFNTPATITMTSSPTGATVSGPSTGTFSGGSASFANFSVDTSGTYIFHIVAANLTLDVTVIATGGRQT